MPTAINKTAAAMSPGMSAATLHVNIAVRSVAASQTPILARSLEAEPGCAASNHRRQQNSTRRLAFDATMNTTAATSPHDLWSAATEFPVRRRKPAMEMAREAMVPYVTNAATMATDCPELR